MAARGCRAGWRMVAGGRRLLSCHVIHRVSPESDGPLFDSAINTRSGSNYRLWPTTYCKIWKRSQQVLFDGVVSATECKYNSSQPAGGHLPSMRRYLLCNIYFMTRLSIEPDKCACFVNYSDVRMRAFLKTGLHYII